MTDEQDSEEVLLFSTTHDDVDDNDLMLMSMSGAEGLSELYRFELVLAYQEYGGLAPSIVKEMLRRPCSIGFGPNSENVVAGILSEIETQPTNASGVSKYRAVLVPRFFRTTQVQKSRVFNEMTFQAITTEILTKDYSWKDGDDFEFKLDGSYDATEYIVQYQESDFNFLSRWFASQGWYYFFEQTDKGDKLIITDSNSFSAAVPEHEEMAYSARGGVAERAGFVGSLTRINRNPPAQVEVRDYNWRRPAQVLGAADVDTQLGYGIQVYYGEHFPDNAAGDAIAEVRAERWRVWAETYEAMSATPAVSAGRFFTLTGSAAGDFDRKYLITRVQHYAGQGEDDGLERGAYSNKITMIDFDNQYRHEQMDWPRIYGYIHAHIDGSEGTAAPIDDQGRYRVQLPFDVKPGSTGQATRWIRMAQPSAGQGYGMHFPLYPGVEVMLTFVDGDVDRPVIAGALPNPATATYVAEARATRAAIRTVSGVVIDIENDA